MRWLPSRRGAACLRTWKRLPHGLNDYEDREESWCAAARAGVGLHVPPLAAARWRAAAVRRGVQGLPLSSSCHCQRLSSPFSDDAMWLLSFAQGSPAVAANYQNNTLQVAELCTTAAAQQHCPPVISLPAMSASLKGKADGLLERLHSMRCRSTWCKRPNGAPGTRQEAHPTLSCLPSPPCLLPGPSSPITAGLQLQPNRPSLSRVLGNALLRLFQRDHRLGGQPIQRLGLTTGRAPRGAAWGRALAEQRGGCTARGCAKLEQACGRHGTVSTPSRRFDLHRQDMQGSAACLEDIECKGHASPLPPARPPSNNHPSIHAYIHQPRRCLLTSRVASPSARPPCRCSSPLRERCTVAAASSARIRSDTTAWQQAEDNRVRGGTPLITRRVHGAASASAAILLRMLVGL